MRRLYLRDFVAGDGIDGVYVLTNKQFSLTNSGKHFIKAMIADRSGQVPARMWNATRELFNAMPDNGFAYLRGHAENYQGNIQFIIETVGPAREGTYDIADLLPHTTKDIPTMCRKLAEMLGSIQNRHLSALVQAYLDDEKLMTDFCRAPAAMSYHHAFLGGLLEHTLNAIEVADAVCRFYPNLSRDLVVAGIFLHDIAKTWELSYASSFGYTDGGQLVGHIVKSAIWVEHKAREAEALLGEKIPQSLIDVIQHIIISHHGLPEFGAIKTPATPEAIAVHMIENMDAKLMTSLQICRGESAGAEGNWTDYNKSMGGRFYRPDVSIEEEVEQVVEEPKLMITGLLPASKDRSAAPIERATVSAEQRPPLPAASHAAPPIKHTSVSPDRAVAQTDEPLKITNPLFDSGPAKRK
ncbi:MAG TPA: HD domain-containing protein [Tepidisphaeraceae bacterium]|jgi:3'-5' exoribonuclease|nr:HD domain-containing protein [Tepidisphaeraceae bacterium]